ncbi:hypothetical protein AAVH_25633 [Aphelenchoides avenae]|nr:hypothetical protein AAVH_25633 [Aphelenchus avenae]
MQLLQSNDHCSGPSYLRIFTFALLNLGHAAGRSSSMITSTTTTRAAGTVHLWLDNHDDRFYTVNVIIGTPGQTMVLTVDTRPGGFIVADVSFALFAARTTFDPKASTTFRWTSSPRGNSNGSGTDLLRVSYPNSDGPLPQHLLPIDVVRKAEGLSRLYAPFLEQPFGGLFYIHGYRNPLMYFPKACTSGTVQGSGFVSYGADVEEEFCEPLSGRVVQSVGEGCPIPSFALVSIGFGSDEAEVNNGYKYDALVVPIPDIAMPEPLFHFLNTNIGATFKDGAYHVNCSIETRLRLRIAVNDHHFFVAVPYLVDKVDSGCVLRMRPLLATENFCETVCGWGPECAANTIILGLPFLHSYCLSYDRDAVDGNIVIYEQRDPPKRDNHYHQHKTEFAVVSDDFSGSSSRQFRRQRKRSIDGTDCWGLSTRGVGGFPDARRWLLVETSQ